MSADHDLPTKCHWGIRYESVRLQLATAWNLPHIADQAQAHLAYWQQRQQQLFDDAQQDSLNA